MHALSLPLQIKRSGFVKENQSGRGEVRGLGLFKLARLRSGFADFSNPPTFWVLRGAGTWQCGPARPRAGDQAHFQCVTESEFP